MREPFRPARHDRARRRGSGAGPAPPAAPDRQPASRGRARAPQGRARRRAAADSRPPLAAPRLRRSRRRPRPDRRHRRLVALSPHRGRRSTADEICFGACGLLLAGTVKGLVGLGLPTITIALTSLVAAAVRDDRPDRLADHLHQRLAGGGRRKVLGDPARRGRSSCRSAVGALSHHVADRPEGADSAFLVLAVVLVVYSGLGLLRIRLHIHADSRSRWRRDRRGLGLRRRRLVGVPVIPLMPYLQGLDIKPTELVQTLGVVPAPPRSRSRYRC